MGYMGSSEAGRLLIYTHVEGWRPDPVAPEDLIQLSAAMQRQFPRRRVEPADLEWLRQTVGNRLPLPPPEEIIGYLRLPSPSESGAAREAYEYVYLVLAWLGGTVSKQVAEQAIKAAADLIRQWMRARRSKIGDTMQVAYILGPRGERLKKVQVRPAAPPARRRTTRRRR
jgi:hypothetical protein